jgi:type I restriction-modification system DNA methylase subunit
MSDPNLSSFIWSVADLLRGDYKQSEYGKVILPFTVLRRLDCVLDETKSDVLDELKKREKTKVNPEPFLLRKSGQLFFNTSPLDLKKPNAPSSSFKNAAPLSSLLQSPAKSMCAPSSLLIKNYAQVY